MSVQFQIDAIIAQAQRLRPDCDPGVRMVASKPHTYDATLLRSFECRELVRGARGVDLRRVTDETLDALASAALRRWADTKHGDHEAGDLADRVICEQRRRGPANRAAA